MSSALSRRFEGRFGRPPDVVASAPGRVNLLGEHTDYNDGFVLPIAIPQRTTLAIAARSDMQVQVWSETLEALAGYELGAEQRAGGFIDYVQGVTAGLRERELAPRGFDAVIESDVPAGSGLSSSAALSVALLRALRELFELALDDLTLVRVAQWGENHVVGAPVGILDPMACHIADERSALFLDTRSLEYARFALPDTSELVVVDSGVRHDHASGGYRIRRAECEAAARALGVGSLRDLTRENPPRVEALPEPLGRRVRHVLTENQRVLSARAYLASADARALGRLFQQSHASMRDDFEVSVPEVDVLVERARRDERVYGARLTGGGFGGSVVCLVERGHAREVGARLARDGARLLIPQADPGS
ncbi:MAG TPA: galactokinase [Polyangiaceae bacterium]|nr:galactokinase [Polyangiaceae bacterium]